MDAVTEFEMELKEAISRMLKTYNNRTDAYAYTTGFLESLVRSLAWRLDYEGKTDAVTYHTRMLREVHSDV